MKPFGVRLAAGGVTIMLGALAAAQAQKDNQNNAESEWSVGAPPSIGDPPAPIEAANSSPSFESSALMAASESFAQSDGPDTVQLAQHTETKKNAPHDLKQLDVESADGALAAPDISIAASGSAAADGPSMAFEIVDSDAPASDGNSAAAPSFGMPSISNHADGANGPRMTDMNAGPAMTMQMPGAAAAMPDNSTNPNGGSFPGPGNSELPPGITFADTKTGAKPNTAGSNAANPANMLRGSTNFGAADMGAPEIPQEFDGEFDAQAAMGPSSNQSVASGPQAILRAVDLPNQGNTDATGSSGPRLVNPAGVPAAAATLRYAQGPDGMAAPPADSQPTASGTIIAPSSNPSFAGNQFNGPPQQFDIGQPPFAQEQRSALEQQTARGINVPGQPAAARIASLPSSPSDYPGRVLDQPTAATQVRVDPHAAIASPGDRHLEGVQSPSVVIHKRAPREVKVGKPASFVIHVQNVGGVEALDVVVHDRIPSGMSLVDASPMPVQQGDALMWQLGDLSAGDERTVTLQLVPEQEGELGSVARVTFEAAASVRTISTRPELKIVQHAPPKVLIGQQVEIELEVSNPGTGDATGVVLQEDVPEGFEHPKGRQLDNMIGTLAAGEVRRQVLRMRAIAPGVIQNQIRLAGDDGLETVDAIEIEVIAPKLQVNLSGPQRRFLERQATYQLEIANVGTADATNVEIAAHLDRGFTFVSTDYEGQYDPSQHTVFWSLANLPEGGSGSVPLTLLPVEEGEQAIRLEVQGDLGISAEHERTVAVDALAELTFSINDVADPIEVGSETTYEIRVSNSGSRNDSNVRVQVQLPPGVQLLGSDADAQEDGRGGIFFDPHNELAANDEIVYRVRVQGMAPGTHLIKAIVISDQSSTPVTKEESTMVYADQ